MKTFMIPPHPPPLTSPPLPGFAKYTIFWFVMYGYIYDHHFRTSIGASNYLENNQSLLFVCSSNSHICEFLRTFKARMKVKSLYMASFHSHIASHIICIISKSWNIEFIVIILFFNHINVALQSIQSNSFVKSISK